MPLPKTLGRRAFALALALAAASAWAADTPPAANDRLAGARALIADQRWAAAIEELRRLDARDSADWHNLMGYSLRKAKAPDYAAAERHYDEALRIDPQHRGALEYSGELHLMNGDLPRAEARLAALDKACLLPCAEYRALKQAIADHKARLAR